MLIPVILSGGSGTRLWPLSRKLYPKQFHRLYGDHSLIQQTCLRAQRATGEGAFIVVANHEHRFLVREQLVECGIEHADVILEPCPRNTAPAVTLAALRAQAADPEAVIAVMPSDHMITDDDAFSLAINSARHWAEQGYLVTFGVTPTGPEPGYGYIERGADLEGDGSVYSVSRFVEKPGTGRAAKMLMSGNFYWNSGIFVFKAAVYLTELMSLCPDVYAACQSAMKTADRNHGFLVIQQESFAAAPSESVDYGIMERTEKAVVLPYSSGWSDIGSWTGLADTAIPGDNDNVAVGDVQLEDTQNSYVYAGSRLVTVIGVKDMVIVETGDAVLVTSRGRDQDVKMMVDRLAGEQRPEVEQHRRVHRPWGSFESLDCGDQFQVKRLIIKPGASISLQLHNHRSEHWVVVKGKATVTRGDDNFVLAANESTYIPANTVHKLQNTSETEVEIIEVQTGDYLGEDDIVRFGDQYGRD
jgi:mannose-1-phosphate guanylyltransferase/mannose-6-phosphate isomerase